MSVDDYIHDVIQKGDEGSELLRKGTAETLSMSQHVDIIGEGANQNPVLRIPEGYVVVVHSASGKESSKGVSDHAASMVDKLVYQVKVSGAVPLGYANVIDSQTGDLDMLHRIIDALNDRSYRYRLPNLNGENAILGIERVAVPANVSGTMISMLPRDHPLIQAHRVERRFEKSGFRYAWFDPRGKAVFINSDGVGTKTEFYELVGNRTSAIQDFLVMTWDDAMKQAAMVMATSGVYEYDGQVKTDRIGGATGALGDRYKTPIVLQPEYMPGRWNTIAGLDFVHNISGSVVSVIEEERLKHPLRPEHNDALIAVKGKPNPRSNGITDLRAGTRALLGEDYHRTKEGKEYLEFLAEPSTVLYPVFADLIERNLASSVYHMSGGSHNGKLARPLAEADCFVEMRGMFDPNHRMLAIMDKLGTTPEAAYAKWNMGTDGYVSTKRPESTMHAIREHGLEAQVVGTLKKGTGRTGVVLADIMASDGKPITYTGKTA